jgi:hypothetical protein
MTKPIARNPIYRQRAFDADIIQLCVRRYVTYRLSHLDLVEIMAERGIKVAHSLRTGLATLKGLISTEMSRIAPEPSCRSVHSSN